MFPTWKPTTLIFPFGYSPSITSCRIWSEVKGRGASRFGFFVSPPVLGENGPWRDPTKKNLGVLNPYFPGVNPGPVVLRGILILMVYEIIIYITWVACHSLYTVKKNMFFSLLRWGMEMFLFRMLWGRKGFMMFHVSEEMQDLVRTRRATVYT